jgi:two-component system, NtrC family, sensor kinase
VRTVLFLNGAADHERESILNISFFLKKIKLRFDGVGCWWPRRRQFSVRQVFLINLVQERPFMSRHVLLIFIFISFLQRANCQSDASELNNFKISLEHAADDSTRINWLYKLANGYRFSNVDSALFYSDRMIELSKKTQNHDRLAWALSLKGATLLESGNLPGSLELQIESLNLSEELNDQALKGLIINRMGNIYMELGDYKKANDFYFRSMRLFQAPVFNRIYFNELSNIGNVYELNNMPDSALYYQQLVYNESLKGYERSGSVIWPDMMLRMGNAYKLKGEDEQALAFYKKGVELSNEENDIRNLTMNNLALGTLYKKMNFPDSGMKYANQAFLSGKSVSFKKGVYNASALLSELYRDAGKTDSAYKYLRIANIERDSLYGAGRFREIQRLVLSQQELQEQLSKERDQIDSRNRTIIFGIVFLFSLIIALYLWYNFRRQKKVNATLREQQSKISAQNIELEKTLNDLRVAQAHLIQSEKMASLGELTAGIAHEIQNPLNFINNFSEVNSELIDEMKKEMKEGNNADMILIAEHINENEQKILLHGKRADAIVKGMLQHARSTPGEKESADINKLADEYLQIAYRGFRAKNKSFSPVLQTEFDPDIARIRIVREDIGRVLMNLYNNAFYAVSSEMKKAPNGYEPTVFISTKKTDDEIEIKVRDNGAGIPPAIIGKIFQPFFTTKPPGQGTGLGLSLSYDIIKAHHGELNVISTEGKGAEFIMRLPVE